MHAANDDVENRFSLPGAAAQYGPDRPIRTRRLDLELEPDLATKTIDAVCTLTVEAIDDDVSSIELDAVDLEVSGAYLVLAGGHRGDALTFKPRSRTLQIDFSRGLRAREQLCFAVTYRAKACCIHGGCLIGRPRSCIVEGDRTTI